MMIIDGEELQVSECKGETLDGSTVEVAPLIGIHLIRNITNGLERNGCSEFDFTLSRSDWVSLNEQIAPRGIDINWDMQTTMYKNAPIMWCNSVPAGTIQVNFKK